MNKELQVLLHYIILNSMIKQGIKILLSLYLNLNNMKSDSSGGRLFEYYLDSDIEIVESNSLFYHRI